MLSSASDYVYINTQGIESCLSGQIIPQNDINNLNSPIRFQDFCYLTEAIRTWSYDANWVYTTNPTYTQSNKYTILANHWYTIYTVLDQYQSPLNPAYGCALYLNNGISSLPVQPRVTGLPTYNKQYFAYYQPNLLFDPTQYMSGQSIDLREKPYDVKIPKTLYWMLFQDCYQDVRNAKDNELQNLYYDSSYTFKQNSVQSGTFTMHFADGGVISTLTGDVEHNDLYSYVMPICETEYRQKSSAPFQLFWYNYYETVEGEYQSGYQYCFNGINENVMSYVNFRRDNIISAYAFVRYRVLNLNTMRYTYQYKFEPLQQQAGRLWYYKSVDYSFGRNLLEYAGADLSKIGTRNPRKNLPEFECETMTYSIFVKFNHKYSEGIKDQWQWQPNNI